MARNRGKNRPKNRRKNRAHTRTLYCLAVDGSKLSLALFAPIERILFQTMLEIGKIIASLEEFSGLKMSWGKLDRKGRT